MCFICICIMLSPTHLTSGKQLRSLAFKSCPHIPKRAYSILYPGTVNHLPYWGTGESKGMRFAWTALHQKDWSRSQNHLLSSASARIHPTFFPGGNCGDPWGQLLLHFQPVKRAFQWKLLFRFRTLGKHKSDCLVVFVEEAPVASVILSTSAGNNFLAARQSVVVKLLIKRTLFYCGLRRKQSPACLSVTKVTTHYSYSNWRDYAPRLKTDSLAKLIIKQH